jgi:hypothetical protein
LHDLLLGTQIFQPNILLIQPTTPKDEPLIPMLSLLLLFFAHVDGIILPDRNGPVPAMYLDKGIGKGSIWVKRFRFVEVAAGRPYTRVRVLTL